MVELVDTQDLKSCSRKRSAGSIPALSTSKSTKLASKEAFFILEKKSVPKSAPIHRSYRKRFLKEKTPYKTPTIVRAKNDWHVRYFYEYPNHPGKFKDFRVRDGINYIHDIDEKEKEIQKLRADIEYALKNLGYNPFLKDTKLSRKVSSAKSVIRHRNALMSLEAAVMWFIKTKKSLGVVDKTLADYERHIRKMINWCKPKGKMRIDDVKIDDIELFLSENLESEEWSARTFNNYTNTITTFFNYLVAKRKLSVNPVGIGMLERISNRAEKNKYYDQETLNKILPEVKKQPNLRRFILWTYYSCARGTELRALKIKHIDLNIKKISIMADTGKTGAYVGKRSIPICQELMDIIVSEDLIRKPKEWYVFGKGGVPGPETIYHAFFAESYYKIKNDLGIDFKYTLYSFKHTRIVDLLMAGFEPIVVMQLTGHIDWGSFQKYIRELGAVMDKKLVGNTLTLNI